MGSTPITGTRLSTCFGKCFFLLWLNAGTISGWLEAAEVSPERQSRLRRILLEPADD